jgi:hypothetical protein
MIDEPLPGSTVVTVLALPAQEPSTPLKVWLPANW